MKTPARLLPAALVPLFLLGLCAPRLGAQVEGEFAALEGRVASAPEDCEARRELAEAYAASGFLEEAVAQYLAIVTLQEDDADARESIKALVAGRMPKWFPREVEGARPFPLQVFDLDLAGRTEARSRVQYRLLVTQAGLPAGEGDRTDRVHKWAFPHIEYGYVWDAEAERLPGQGWVMKGRVHWAREEDRELAQSSLKAFLALWCVANEYLDRDPTRPWGQPVDLWLAEQGEPGARAVGRDIYLYATKTPRAPAEWWRELAHEYGHVSLPGIGGFTDTDDPWADGELGELLFVKWLARGQEMSGGSASKGQEASSCPTSRLPWSVEEAERIAAARRQTLIAGSAGPTDTARLNGTDAKAKDYFLGLALRVEQEAGPGLLAEALAQCPRGRPAQFVAALARAANPGGGDER